MNFVQGKKKFRAPPRTLVCAPPTNIFAKVKKKDFSFCFFVKTYSLQRFCLLLFIKIYSFIFINTREASWDFNFFLLNNIGS